ncbi:MAG: GuaB3 family IMP dehydrogenase-related protein [Actinomycetes bacterium]
MADVEIGGSKAGQRGYHLRDISILPSRRTRDAEDVSTAWQLDAFRFDIPMIAHPSDATMSPATAVAVSRLGGLGVLNGEGLWTRYVDPSPILDEFANWPDDKPATPHLQQVYAEPVQPDLITRRIKEMADEGAVTAVRFSPQHTEALAPAAVAAGVDLLVIQGTVVSAEHVSSRADGHGPLNLKTFIAALDVPVIVGGCATYQTALHLMRTGAAGVIVGTGSDAWATSDDVLAIRVPMATAITEAAAARRDYLDETGGRYVHVIADGEIETSGDIARALACGADAVTLGEPLSLAAEAPARGCWWDSVAAHPKLPRGSFAGPGMGPMGSLEQVLRGPANDPTGHLNLFGALRRTLAKTGYSDLKEFQRVDVVVDG